MDQLDHDYNVHITPGGGDDSLLVRFFIDAVEDSAASKLAGRLIYRDAEWIDMRAPGPRGEGVIRPVRKGDAERFPKHYAAFKARVSKDAEEIVGTPLSTWAWQGMTRARVEELKFFNCRTVEQLANMPDNIGQPIMHFQQMKQAAKQYLETVKLSAPLARLQVQLEQAVAKITEQSVTIARLHAKVHGLPEPAAADVVVPMRVEIERELETIKAATPPAPVPPPPPSPQPQPEPLQAQGEEMAKKRKAPPPPRRRPGY
jgi:hypothetical protein